MTTNLVVADKSRTEKTICLAVSPSLKAYGIPGRPRLFEVVQKVMEVNGVRKKNAPGRKLTGSSCQSPELEKDPALAVDFVDCAAPGWRAIWKSAGRFITLPQIYIARRISMSTRSMKCLLTRLPI